MAKVTGLSWTTLQVDDSSGTARDIRTDVQNFNFSTPRGVQDSTGIDKAAMERLPLLTDFSITITGVFDPGANLAHAVFSTVPSTSVNRSVNITTNAKNLNQGTAVLFTDYGVTRNQDGSLTYTAPGVLANGVVPTWT